MTIEKTVAIEDVLAEIENIVHRRTQQHVFRDGRDGSFTDDGATIGAAIVALLEVARTPDNSVTEWGLRWENGSVTQCFLGEKSARSNFQAHNAEAVVSRQVTPWVRVK